MYYVTHQNLYVETRLTFQFIDLIQIIYFHYRSFTGEKLKCIHIKVVRVY